MGTMKSFSKCDPKRDYTYVECLEMAAQHDYDMMESIIKNGTAASKEHLVEVGKLMIDGMDDSMSDHGSFILEELGYDRCPCCSEVVPKENIEEKYKED